MKSHHSKVQLSIRVVIVKMVLLVLFLFDTGLDELIPGQWIHLFFLGLSVLIIWQVSDYLQEVHATPINKAALLMIVISTIYFIVVALVGIEALSEEEAILVYTLPSGIENIGYIMMAVTFIGNKASDAYKDIISNVGIAYLISMVMSFVLPFIFEYFEEWVSIVTSLVHLWPLAAILWLYKKDLDEPAEA